MSDQSPPDASKVGMPAVWSSTMCPVEMAIRCDAICQMAVIAAQTGRVIQWDPEKEAIVGDAEASRMFVRPFREKWRVW